MSKIKWTGLVVALLISTALFAQPSDAELTGKIRGYYKNTSAILSIKLDPAKIERRWVKDKWKYFWSKKYYVKTKTEYAGVTMLSYGGVQYHKNGSTYTYDRILTGGTMGYEGIPNPSESTINSHLKSSYDPLNFYSNYLMSYLIDAPNNVKLAEDPQWKWTNLNEVSCIVEASFTRKVDDIGNVEVQEGSFRINLQRSADGKTYSPDSKLMKSGKWLPLSKGSKITIKTTGYETLSADEIKTKKTLAQLNQVRYAEERKKSLAVVQMPEFKNGNHLMMFVHDLLLEGDKEKVEALLFQMLPRNNFEEWSDAVLNQNGERLMEQATKNLVNYKDAFCQFPIVKEMRSNYVRFYDRNKRRMNRIAVSFENNRWYVTEIRFTIWPEDLPKYAQSGETYCNGDPIFIDAAPKYKAGDKVMVLINNNWYNGEIVKPEMEKGGYAVKYGHSGLSEWVFASKVKDDPNNPIKANSK